MLCSCVDVGNTVIISESVVPASPAVHCSTVVLLHANPNLSCKVYSVFCRQMHLRVHFVHSFPDMVDCGLPVSSGLNSEQVQTSSCFRAKLKLVIFTGLPSA